MQNNMEKRFFVWKGYLYDIYAWFKLCLQSYRERVFLQLFQT